MKELLNSKKTGLVLFADPIQVDFERPKWKNAKKNNHNDAGRAYDADTYVTLQGTSTQTNPVGGNLVNNQFVVYVENPEDGMTPSKNAVTFDDIASLGLKDLNVFVHNNRGGLLSCLGVTGNYWTTPSFAEGQSLPYPKKVSFFKKLFGKVKKGFEPKPEFDVIQFFTAIKATTRESATGYVNRVNKYLRAIHSASSIGQTALVEKLAREMVANKYESFLAAEGYYYVVSEEQVVNFAKKSEKGVALDYIKNFVRPIPDVVVEKIQKADALEIFDNYVIMHYDPESKSYMDTAKEEIKRRDPIVFGVIAGSNNLYYITDWIDDYCDLTLTKFVDTLKIETNDLIKDEEERKRIAAEAEAKAAEKKKRAEEKKAAEKKTAPKKKKTTKKKTDK